MVTLILFTAAVIEGALQSWAEFALVLIVIVFNAALGLVRGVQWRRVCVCAQWGGIAGDFALVLIVIVFNAALGLVRRRAVAWRRRTAAAAATPRTARGAAACCCALF
jgi:hypothetical protein